MADTLADLVTRRAAGRGWTDLAAATGGAIPAYRWRQMATLPVSGPWEPHERQVAVIARVLGVEPGEVLDAVRESQAAARG